MRAAVLGIGVCLVAAAAWSAERHTVRKPGRSLDGMWTTNSLTSFERPEELKSLVLSEEQAAAYELKHRGKPPPIPDDVLGAAESEWWETDVGLGRVRGRPRSSWIVSPADGQVPFTAQAKAANKARREQGKTNFDHPEARPRGERCLETGGPPLEGGAYNTGFKIVQAPGAVAIFTEWMNAVRVVRLDGGAHPPRAVRFLSGDSVGRWEGDTLVVETTNFAPEVVNAANGDAQADMRVVERFRRLSPVELHYEFFISNPARYAQPIQGEMVFAATRAPIFEFACHEGNYSLRHALAGGRQSDAAAPGGSAAASIAP